MTGGEDAMPPQQVDAYWYQWYFQTSMGEKTLTENLDALCEHIWHRWSPTWKFSSSEFKQSAEFWRNPQFVAVTLSSYRHRYGNALGCRAYGSAQAILDTKPKPSITVPTTFIYGTDDACQLPASSEEQHKYFTGPYQRLAIKGVGHIPHQEDPRAVAKLLQRFLDDIKRT
jgi:pimeloyl-ACP methyl ester carboxylesterase